LFSHEWTENDPLSGGGDGVGPVFNAKSCVACHFQGGTGGGGTNDKNVQAFEVMPTRLDGEMHAGVVHAAATRSEFQETAARVKELYPIVPQAVQIIGGCTVTVADFDPVAFASINTPALFGAGEIDGISGWAIRNNKLGQRFGAIGKELSGDFSTTPTGRVRVLPDGRVGKFGWKAQFATLEEFVATACAVELGLSNSIRKQDLPREHRPDDAAALDMTSRQLDGLVAFCSLLDTPERVLPDDPQQRSQAERGEQLFTEIGCADCHTPDLGGVAGLYSDLCLHSLEGPDSDGYVERPEVPLSPDMPQPDEWKTPPLWGVADSAPYLHDGSAATLKDAILAHEGEARQVTKRFRESLARDDQAAVIAFLKTLRAPQ
jgi:CxxC motif-containing protein (DUF1111 family)